MRRLRQIFLLAEPEIVELKSGFIAINLGLSLLAQTGDPTAHTSVCLARIAPEWVWGLALLGLGIGQMTALLGGAWGTDEAGPHLRPRLQARRWCAGMLGLVWGALALVLALCNWRYPSVPAFTAFAGSALWIFLRLGADLEPRPWDRTSNSPSG